LLELKNVTLIAVTSVRVKQALWALRQSSKAIKYAEVKLLTHERPRAKDVCVETIDRLDRDGYSNFIVYDLYRHFDTDFALLIQDDGYVVNPASWREEFLAYDYIGAPWPDGWYPDEEGRSRRVGNGGFSLRSRKLCRVASELGLPWQSFQGHFNEDAFICAYNLKSYEAQGCRIAPLDVAKYFSHEAELPETAGITPFGFHGNESKHNLRLDKVLFNRLRKIAPIRRAIKYLKSRGRDR